MWIDQRGSTVLERVECFRLVALAARGHAIGRLAVSTEASPIVVPVNFGYRDACVLVRIGPGTLARIVPGRLVTLEVDAIDEVAGEGWSVAVRGLARVLGAPDLERMGAALPEPVVPTPGDLVLSIRGDVVTGRRFPVGNPSTAVRVGPAG